MSLPAHKIRLSARETLAQWFRAAILHKTLPTFLFTLEKYTYPFYRRQRDKLATGGQFSHTAIPPLWQEGNFHKTILLMVNGRGGGADTFTRNKARLLEAQGVRVLFAHYHPLKFRWVVARYGIHHSQEKHFSFPWRYGAFVQLLRDLKLQELHVHGTRFLPFYFVRDITALAQLLNVTLEYTAHDFTAICPRLHLFDAEYRYCGMPQDIALCNNCIHTRGRLVIGTPLDIRVYREVYAGLLGACKKITGPSQDAVERIRQYLPQLDIKATPHPVISEVKPVRFPPEGKRRRIGIIGAIQRHKGADVLLACVEDAKRRNLPLDFTVFGYTCYDATLRSLGCTITGRYKEEQLSSLLQQFPCHLAFLPSTWPETFCHTLTHALGAGMYPVVFDFGAPAERLREAGRGTLLPYQLMDDPARINDRLLSISLTGGTGC